MDQIYKYNSFNNAQYSISWKLSNSQGYEVNEALHLVHYDIIHVEGDFPIVIQIDGGNVNKETHSYINIVQEANDYLKLLHQQDI